VNAPFFIIGTERSGSNLLRLILTSHSRLAIPHPPHLVRYFKGLHYGDLSQEAPFRALLGDVRKLLDTHIYPWEVELDWESCYRKAMPRDIFGIYYQLYQQYAEAHQKQRWGCKSTFMVEEVPTTLSHHPDARFLFLYRDPRAVAASSTKSVFSTTHPYFTAKLWCHQQSLGLKWTQTWPSSVLKIAYEELVATPKEQVERICGFLGEQFEEQMLSYFKTEEAKKSGSLSASWANTAAPISTASVASWKKTLSPHEIALIETVCKEPMLQLGYTLEQPPCSPSAVEKLWYKGIEKLGDLKIELKSLKEDKNAALRWRRAMLLTRLRWTRF
jgi:hypothetical protein